jgi:non-canonical (house-cleaning) NTP pyrophosphatase
VELPDGEGALRPMNVGCAALADGARTHLGFTSGFAYPPACSGPALRHREPIGELFDRLWRERRDEAEAVASGRSVGNVGKLTLGELTRAEYGRHAVLCALVALLHPDLYPAAGPAA